ncbi:MAG: hypothetical protein LAP40_02585 [Acidobacteriia bacterium]|nr:hypothetical protein [Terriglobia bacterium]
MSPVDTLKVTPARQAGRILAAWNAGDEPLLQMELQNSQGLRCPSGQGLDEERLELLWAVSGKILRARLPLQENRRDPAVRRCLDLLAHLAHTPHN